MFQLPARRAGLPFVVQDELIRLKSGLRITLHTLLCKSMCSELNAIFGLKLPILNVQSDDSWENFDLWNNWHSSNADFTMIWSGMSKEYIESLFENQDQYVNWNRILSLRRKIQERINNNREQQWLASFGHGMKYHKIHTRSIIILNNQNGITLA